MILAIVLTITTFPQIAIAAPLFRLWSDIGLFNTLIGPDHPVPHVRAAAERSTSWCRSSGRSRGTSRRRRWSTARRTSRRSARSSCRWRRRAWPPPAILTFIAAWNEFLLAITLTSSSKARTVPAAIAFFTGSTEFEVAAREHLGGVGGDLDPADHLVLLFQKRIVAGLTAGAVKG